MTTAAANSTTTGTLPANTYLRVLGDSIVTITRDGLFVASQSTARDNFVGPYPLDSNYSVVAGGAAIDIKVTGVEGPTEARVPAKLSTDANGNTVLVGADGDEYKLEMGSIALVGVRASWDGTNFGSLAIPTEPVLAGTSLGTTLCWTTVVHNDFGTGAFLPATEGVADATAQPSRIYVPPGASQMSFSGSLFFAARSGGIRWVRCTYNATQSHLSNLILAEASAGVVGQTVPLPHSGWIPTTGVDYIELHAIQNTGTDLNLQAGAGIGGSTFFRASFR